MMCREAILLGLLVVIVAGVAEAGGPAAFFDRDAERPSLVQKAEADFLRLPRPASYEVEFEGKVHPYLTAVLEGQWHDVAYKYPKYVLFDMTRKYVKMPEYRYDALLLLAGAPESEQVESYEGLWLTSYPPPPNWLYLMAKEYGWEGTTNPYDHFYRRTWCERVLGEEKMKRLEPLENWEYEAAPTYPNAIRRAELPKWFVGSFTVAACVKYHRRAPAGSRALRDSAIRAWVLACIVWDSPSDAMELFADVLRRRRLDMGRDDGRWHEYLVAILACCGAQKADQGLALNAGAKALLQYLVICPSEESLDTLARIWGDEGLQKADKEWVVGLLRGVLADEGSKSARGVAGDWRKVLDGRTREPGQVKDAFVKALETWQAPPRKWPRTGGDASPGKSRQCLETVS